MTNLEQLRESVRILEEMKSISLTPETLKEVDNLKERIIRDGILPAISEEVAPLLKPTQPKSVPAPESNPDEEIVADETLLDVGERRAPNTKLRVTFNDGTVIQERFSWQTFFKAIKAAGVDNVRDLDLKLNNRPLISVDANNKLTIQKETSNYQRKALLERISTKLKLGWKVEMVDAE